MNMYVNIDFMGTPVGETMIFTDKADLIRFIELEMELWRTVTIRPEAVIPQKG